MTLYEIDAEILALMDQAVDPETGEINESVYEDLDRLQMDREHKVEAIALAYKNAKADAEAYKAEKMSFAKKQSAAENNAERLKNYLAYALNGEKFKTSKVSVSYRKSETVNYTDIDMVPKQYIRYKDPEVDKVNLKDALKMGAKIPGVWLEEKQNVQVR